MGKSALPSKVEDDLLLSEPDDNLFDKDKETRTSKSKRSAKSSTRVKASPSSLHASSSSSKPVTPDDSELSVSGNDNLEILNLLKQIREDQNKTIRNV